MPNPKSPETEPALHSFTKTKMDSTQHGQSSVFRLMPVLLTLLSGAILWIVVMLFEEFVTADLRWDLWVAGGLLFVVSACLGRLRYGIWAPILVAAPLVGLYGRIVVLDTSFLWPYIPLWVACTFGGWLVTKHRGPRSFGFAAIVAILIVGYGSWTIPRQLAEAFNVFGDEPAPVFSLELLDGNPFPMETLQGKVVVLDFFSTWCAPYVAELPEIEQVQRSLSHREDVVFLIVGDGAGGDSREQVAAFADAIDLDLRFAYDPEGVAHDAFGFSNVPALAVIDREGRVRFRHVGYNSAETGFRRSLTKLISTL